MAIKANAEGNRREKDSKKRDTPCSFFQQGMCTKGKACKFKHIASTNTNETPKPEAVKNVDYLRKKCTRTHKNPTSDHPAFACKDENTKCQKCNKKGHTTDCCPEQKCKSCGSAHSTRVHGWSNTQIFQ